MKKYKLEYLIIIVLCVAIIFAGGVVVMKFKPAQNVSPKPQQIVASAVSTPSPTNIPKAVKTQSVSQSPTTTSIVRTKKKEYSIAVYGDSMVETMGERTDYLEHRLNEMFPGVKFDLYNYGIGGENAQKGLDRFGSSFNYKTRKYPPITDLHPDIIIVGSFAYNPPVPYERDKHWLTLIELVKRSQGTGAQVYLLSEIAPLENNFGKGPGGVNWPDEMSRDQARKITELLENAVNLGTILGIPVINAYDATNGVGKYGSSAYTDPHDGIHPSVAGHTLMANMIAQRLRL